MPISKTRLSYTLAGFACAILAACSDDGSGSSDSDGSGGTGEPMGGLVDASGGTTTGSGGASDTGGSKNDTGGSGGDASGGGGGSSAGSGGASSGGGTGDSSGGSGANTGAVGGSGGSGGTGGDGGNGSDAGGEGGEGVVGCPATNFCSSPGALCRANALVECELDADDCLLETVTPCDADVCDVLREEPSCVPVASQTADSCAEKRYLEGPAAIAGDAFNNDFSDQHDFSGANCALTTFEAPEAVYYIDVPAGESVSVSEVRDSTDDPIGLDAVFGIMSSCSNEAACLRSGGLDDSGGITYTAEQDETVAIWVSGTGALDGSYDIRVELPTTLGSFGLGEDLPPVAGGPLDPGQWEAYVVHLEETAVLRGDMLTGYANVGISDVYGGLLLNSATLDHFLRVFEPGTYRLVVSAPVELPDYELALSTRPWTELGGYATGGNYTGDHGSIAEGDSVFYLFEVSEGAVAEVFVSTSSGDADLWLFSREGAFWNSSSSIGATEELTSFLLYPGAYLLEVVAYPGSGDITNHSLQIDFVSG